MAESETEALINNHVHIAPELESSEPKHTREEQYFIDREKRLEADDDKNGRQGFDYME